MDPKRKNGERANKWEEAAQGIAGVRISVDVINLR